LLRALITIEDEDGAVVAWDFDRLAGGGALVEEVETWLRIVVWNPFANRLPGRLDGFEGFISFPKLAQRFGRRRTGLETPFPFHHPPPMRSRYTVREEEQVARLRKLWESLELEILSVLEATNRLRESPEFELYELTAKQPEMLDGVVAKQTAGLEVEIAKLKSEAVRLEKAIEELTGGAPMGRN